MKWKSIFFRILQKTRVESCCFFNTSTYLFIYLKLQQKSVFFYNFTTESNENNHKSFKVKEVFFFTIIQIKQSNKFEIINQSIGITFFGNINKSIG